MKQFIFRLLIYTGLPLFFREIIQKNKVTFLLFHDIKMENAKMIFRYLKNNYSLITLDTYLEIRNNNNRIKFPKKSLIITFDDGYTGNYDILPVIKEHRIPITIFLCTEIINTNRFFWFLVEHPEFKVRELKNKANHEKLEILKEVDFTLDKEYEFPVALSKDQIKEMTPYINFQSHGMFHPILTKCTDKEANDEVFNSKQKLETEYKLKINAFSFPNGDYSEREIELCKKAGYKCALTVDYGFNSIRSDPYTLKRIPLDDTEDIHELIVKSSGLSEFLSVIFGFKKKSKFEGVKM